MKLSKELLLLLFCVIAVTYGTQYELLDYNPVASNDSIVIAGNARFTVLTSRLIRMEYSSGSDFEDRATLAFVNRELPVPSFSQNVSDGVLTIITSELTLHYTLNETFSAESLSVSSTSSSFEWSPGMPNNGNLLGTIKSLDELGVVTLNCTEIEIQNLTVHDESLHCQWGLVSRDGWSVVDDSDNWAVDETYWWQTMNKDDVDWYFFGHGHDYMGAIQDYTLVGGKTPMLPRFANGIWWSRWFNYNNWDVRQVVQGYESRDIPLDVYILDMDWHTKEGWGGYSFDTHLFPYPWATLTWLHDQGLVVAANLHDDDGIRSNEDSYEDFAKAIGFSTSSGDTIPFDICNQTWAYALEDITLQMVEKNDGMDFWWIDWQQGGTQGNCAGAKQNPTILLNKLRSTDNMRRGSSTRGLVLARWGGLGNHRYQVGFSGDVDGLSWENLAFQPYFSWTSSNVAYGYWSHDIVGPSDDYELYTRWIQWGAVSGVFRSHDRGMAAGGCADNQPSTCGIIKMWDVPTPYFEVNRAAVQARERLIPYIYTHTRYAYETGVGLLRPMYYHFPECDLAYSGTPDGSFSQYMFGVDMFVAPVVVPADNTTMALVTIWVPPGLWVERNTGQVYNGSCDTTITTYFDLRETPTFVRGGAIIPEIVLGGTSSLGVASRDYDTLVFEVYPGASSAVTKVYNDDGTTTAYLNGTYSWTVATYNRTEAFMNFTTSTVGNYNETASRTIVLKVINSVQVNTISINGKQITYSRTAAPNSWTYSGVDLTLIVTSDALPVSQSVDIAMVFSTSLNSTSLSGFKGAFYHLLWAKQILDDDELTPGGRAMSNSYLSVAASTAEALGYLAGTSDWGYFDLLSNFPKQFRQAFIEVSELSRFALVQLYDGDREDSCLCGSFACQQANGDYSAVRIEGFQPNHNETDAVPLDLYFSSSLDDNWVTTSSDVPSNYTGGSFSNGYVFPFQKANTIALQLWYSSARNDHLTVASAEGVAWAQQNSYVLLNDTLGYVYDKASFTHPNLVGSSGVASQRILYALTLLQAASI